MHSLSSLKMLSSYETEGLWKTAFTSSEDQRKPIYWIALTINHWKDLQDFFRLLGKKNMYWKLTEQKLSFKAPLTTIYNLFLQKLKNEELTAMVG